MIQAPHPHRLKSIEVVGGFLDGLKLDLAGGLNCLISHRGAGKSTALEFIRHALQKAPLDGTGRLASLVPQMVEQPDGRGRLAHHQEVDGAVPQRNLSSQA